MIYGVTLPLREAYYSKLKNIQYLGVRIPVCEEYLNENEAVLNVGNSKQIRAYILLMNQTENDDSNVKCMKNDQSSIQIQVNTVFNANSGNSEHAEKIANIILGILYPTIHYKIDIILPEPYDLWKTQIVTSRNINYQNNSDRIWTKQIVINNFVSQS